MRRRVAKALTGLWCFVGLHDWLVRYYVELDTMWPKDRRCLRCKREERWS